MKKLLLLLFLPAQLLFAQNTPLDSLERLFANEKSNAQQFELLQQMVDISFGMDFKQALGYAKRGVALAEKTGDKNWQPKFYEMQGRMHANLLQLDSARLMLDKATSGYIAVGNKKGQATTAFKISWIFKRKSELAQSMAYDLDALRLMEEINDQGGIADALGRIAWDLTLQDRPKEALEYAKRAIDICKKNNLQKKLIESYRFAGDASIRMTDYKQALDYYEQALAMTLVLEPDLTAIADISNSRGNALKRLGRYEEALKDYRLCLENAQKSNYPGGIHTAIANLGEVNLLMGNYAEALPYQLKTIELQEKNGDLIDLVENYTHASSIYEHLGNDKSALLYHKKALLLRDSIASLESDAAVSELRTKYETEKKEATITQQEAQISQQRMVQWLGFGVIGLLAVLAFVLWRSYASRSLANRLLTVTNDQLATKNAENELLLKEIHHRVKNNLQTISSLLNLQSASIKDPNALEAVQESQSRVRSMALIHQKLYQGENLAAVNMKEYFEAMGQSMLHSFGETGKRITLEVPMNDLELDVDTAIPLGLIANELVTNSLKYAFPDGQKGQIEISLTAEPNQQFCLRIADNGVGQTESPVVQGTGFGTRLVKLLAIQLNGNVETNTAKGMATLVRFSPIPKAA
ncbi:MAG: hypothetical protein RIR11_3438 [Bacteroidota bacterium]|jgi:two-component sensor histidine kinase